MLAKETKWFYFLFVIVKENSAFVCDLSYNQIRNMYDGQHASANFTIACPSCNTEKHN